MSGPLNSKAQSWQRWKAALFASAVTLLLGSGTAFAQAEPRQAPQKRPNVLIILADDLGYSDIGAFGGDIHTPNLDALAKRGVRMTNFYNMARSTPSRASLVTGRYPHRIGMGEFGKTMDKTVPTVAEDLRKAGYATSMVGKWHLTEATEMADQKEHMKWLNHQGHFDRDFGDLETYPTARGFDKFYGLVWGVADYYDPFSLVDGTKPVTKLPKDYYITYDLTDRAVSEVKSLSAGGKPFFLYLSYTAAHWPLHAPEKVIQKYLAQYKDGWDALEKKRYQNQVKLGLTDPKTTQMPALEAVYPNNDAKTWAALTPEQKAMETRKMATHAAMVDILDQGVGKVIAALKASGQYDNTVIIFLSDNGASPEIMVNSGYDRPSQTRDGREITYGQYMSDIGAETTMACIGASWANAVNTPWRYWKAESFDGGIHTPFVISWPAHMSAKAGSVDASYGSIIDLAPTLLDVAGAKPSAWKSPIDGVSIAPVLGGKPVKRDTPLFFEHQGGRSVFDGQWKLVSKAPKQRATTYLPWQLFDMTNDKSQMHDVAAQHPETVADLAKKWTAWAAEVGVTKRQEP
jgi:arylsulfatase